MFIAGQGLGSMVQGLDHRVTHCLIHVRASIIGIAFWGHHTIIIIRNPQDSISNLGPYNTAFWGSSPRDWASGGSFAGRGSIPVRLRGSRVWVSGCRI